MEDNEIQQSNFQYPSHRSTPKISNNVGTGKNCVDKLGLMDEKKFHAMDQNEISGCINHMHFNQRPKFDVFSRKI